MKFKIAVAQTDAKVGDLQGNLKNHLEVVEKARSAGAQVVVFPELSLTGYSLRDLTWEVALDPFSDRRLDPLRKASESVSIVFGLVESAENHGVYNSAVFLEDGKILHIHRKIYPPTYGMFEEGRYFSRGHEVKAFDSKLGRFGILVCEDLWHLSLPYLLAYDGAQAIISLTASPSRLAAESEELETARVNHEQHRTYGRLLSTYIVFSNRVGFEDGVNFWGGSSIVSPGGQMLAQGKLFKQDLILAEIDSLEVQRSRRFSRHLLDEDLELVEKTLARLRNAPGLRSSEKTA